MTIFECALFFKNVPCCHIVLWIILFLSLLESFQRGGERYFFHPSSFWFESFKFKYESICNMGFHPLIVNCKAIAMAVKLNRIYTSCLLGTAIEHTVLFILLTLVVHDELLKCA